MCRLRGCFSVLQKGEFFFLSFIILIAGMFGARYCAVGRVAGPKLRKEAFSFYAWGQYVEFHFFLFFVIGVAAAAAGSVSGR